MNAAAAIVAVAAILVAASCSPGRMAATKQREQLRAVGMPAEMIRKVVIQGSIVSAVRNPFTSLHKGVSMSLHRGEALVGPVLGPLPEASTTNRGGQSIEQALDAIGMPRPVPGNVSYLIGGRAFFQDLDKSVRSARQYVDTRMFIFDNDGVARRYADLLKHKSATVRCRVLMDELGSISSWWETPGADGQPNQRQPVSMFGYLRHGGKVSVRKSRNPWLVADHAKQVIIDGKTAYLGGMNIGHEYRHDWHDMMIKVSGPVVTALKNDFDRAWALQGGWGDWGLPFHRNQRHRTHTRPGEVAVRILKTAPGKTQIEQAMVAAIRMSRRRVWVHNSYFTSNVLLREMLAASARGVDVRMVFPRENDSALLNKNNRSVANRMLDGGVRVYMYQPRFSHIKAIVVDGWACVGSANFDTLSLRINGELNIAFSDPKAVGTLVRDLFLKDMRQSRKLRKADARGWHNPLAEGVAGQL